MKSRYISEEELTKVKEMFGFFGFRYIVISKQRVYGTLCYPEWKLVKEGVEVVGYCDTRGRFFFTVWDYTSFGANDWFQSLVDVLSEDDVDALMFNMDLFV